MGDGINGPSPGAKTKPDVAQTEYISVSQDCFGRGGLVKPSELAAVRGRHEQDGQTGMTWELLLSKGLNTALVLGFFALVIFFLRFLYGPKGRLREAQWDAWNAEARLELEKELEAKADASLREAFTVYARSWFSGDTEVDRPLALKLEHTFQVCAHAEELAAAEPALADRRVARALRIAALFHDVARFEQYARYKTFHDEISFNHGMAGARILLRQGFLKREDKDTRRLVVRAVAMHNRPALPGGLPETLRLVLLALRDADKLDILHVLEEHLRPGAVDSAIVLHLKDEPESYSPVVLAALEERRPALYRDMRFRNDFRIVLCTWLFDMNFSTALRIVKRNGCLEHIIEDLAGVPEVREKARAAASEVLGGV